MGRLVVTGGRAFFDKKVIGEALTLADEEWGFDTLIHGGAPGVDNACANWAQFTGKRVITFNAQWNIFGKRAGFIRNEQMIVEGKPDFGLVFPGGKGTLSMHKLLIKYNVLFKLIEV